MTWGTKNMPPKKNLSRGSLSNWCDADADADSSKTICRPPPYGGQHKKRNPEIKLKLKFMDS